MTNKKAVNPLTIYESVNKQNTVLLHEQILHIMQKTPTNHIYKRPAKGGGNWDFVTGAYVKKVLNYVFAWNWDFEIKDKGVEGDLMWVLGKLTVRTKDGVSITKEQFGRADMKKKKDGSGYLDYGNDLKAAATDALKKCASELGIASDVYAKNEFKEVEVQIVETEDVLENKEHVRIKSFIMTCKNATELEDNCKEYMERLEKDHPLRKLYLEKLDDLKLKD